MRKADMDERHEQVDATVVGREQGFTLVVALLVMGLLTTLGLSLLFTAETERTMSRNFSGTIQASFAAESVAEAMAGSLLFDLTQDTVAGWANEYLVVCDLPAEADCLARYGFDPTAVPCALPAARTDKCVMKDTTGALSGIKDQWVANLRYRPTSFTRPAFPSQIPMRLWGGTATSGEEGLKDVLVWWKKFDFPTTPLETVDHLNSGEAEIALTSICTSACGTSPVYAIDQVTVTGIGSSSSTLTGKLSHARHPATRSVAIKLEGSILGVWGNALVGGGQTTDNDPIIDGNYLIRGSVLMFNEDPSRTVLTFPGAGTGVVNNYYDTDSSLNTIDPWWWLDAVGCKTGSCDATNTSLAASHDSDDTAAIFTVEPIAHHIPTPPDLNTDTGRPGGYRSDVVSTTPSASILYPGPEGLEAIVRVNRGTVNMGSGLIGRDESDESAPPFPGHRWDNVLEVYMNDTITATSAVRRKDRGTWDQTGLSGPFDIDTTVIDFPKLTDTYTEPVTLELYDSYYDFLRPAAPGTHPGGWALDLTGIDGGDRAVGQLNTNDCWPSSGGTKSPTISQVKAAFEKAVIPGCPCIFRVRVADTTCGEYSSDTAQECNAADPTSKAKSCRIVLELDPNDPTDTDGCTDVQRNSAICQAPGRVQFTIPKRYGVATGAYALPGAEDELNLDSSSSIDSPKGRAQATMHNSFAYKLYRDVIKAMGEGSCGDENASVLWTKNLKTLPAVLDQTIPTTYNNQANCYKSVGGPGKRAVPCFAEREAYMDVHIQLPQVPVTGQQISTVTSPPREGYCTGIGTNICQLRSNGIACAGVPAACHPVCGFGQTDPGLTCDNYNDTPDATPHFTGCLQSLLPARCNTPFPLPNDNLKCRCEYSSATYTKKGNWTTLPATYNVTATTTPTYPIDRRWLSVRFRRDGDIVVLADPRARAGSCNTGPTASPGPKTDLTDEIVERLDLNLDPSSPAYDQSSDGTKYSRVQLQSVDYPALNYPPNYAYAKPVDPKDLTFRNMPTGAFVVALHLPCSDDLNDLNPYKCSETDGSPHTAAYYAANKPAITYRGFFTHIISFGPKYSCWEAQGTTWTEAPPNDSTTGSPHELAPSTTGDSCGCPAALPYGDQSWFAETIMQANSTTLLNTPVLYRNGSSDGNPLFQHQASAMTGFKLTIGTNTTGNALTCWDGIDTSTGRQTATPSCMTATGVRMAYLPGDGVPCNETGACPFSNCDPSPPPELNGDESDCLDGLDNGPDGVMDGADPDCRCGRDADFVPDPALPGGPDHGWAFGGQTEMFTPVTNRRAGMIGLDPRSVIDTPFNRFRGTSTSTNRHSYNYAGSCDGTADCNNDCYYRGVDPDIMSSWYDLGPNAGTPVFTTNDPRNRYNRPWPGWGSVNVLQGAGMLIANRIRFGHPNGAAFNRNTVAPVEDCNDPGPPFDDEDDDGWINDRDPDCNNYMAGYRSDPIIYDGRLIMYAGNATTYPTSPGGTHESKVFIHEHVVPRGVMGCSDFLSVLSSGDTEINMPIAFDGGVAVKRHLIAMFSLTNGTLKLPISGCTDVQHELVGSWISDSAEFGAHVPAAQIIGIPGVIDLECTHKYLPGDKRVVQSEVLSYMEAETLPRNF